MNYILLVYSLEFGTTFTTTLRDTTYQQVQEIARTLYGKDMRVLSITEVVA